MQKFAYSRLQCRDRRSRKTLQFSLFVLTIFSIVVDCSEYLN